MPPYPVSSSEQGSSIFRNLERSGDRKLTEGSEERIEVIAYSGYRGEETPRTVLFRWKKMEVVEILKRWIEEGSDDREIRRFYRIKVSDGALYTIYYDEKSMEWFRTNKE
jgi:hypothetical protein